MRRRRKRRLSPRALQALIWAGALGVCAVFAVALIVAKGRSRPMLPEPKAVPVGPEVAQAGPGLTESKGGASPEAEPSFTLKRNLVLPAISAAEERRAPAQAGPRRPQKLTESLFVRISAEMLVAADSFSPSEVGQRSFERACEGILERHRVTRADFERMEAEIAGDPQRQAAVVDRVLEEADRMRQPTDIRIEARATPAVDPRRPPPRPPQPATPTR